MIGLRALIPGAYTRRERIAGVCLFVSYFIAAYIGSKLFVAPTVIVPAAGIALAGLVLEGVLLWPFIYAAALLLALINGYSLPTLVLLPIAQTLQPFLGAYILKKVNFDPLMRRLSDTFSFLGVALTVSVIVPSLGKLALLINAWVKHTVPGGITWGSWWTGQIMALLVFAPLIIRWGAEPFFYRLPQYRKLPRILEIATVFIALTIINVFIGWGGIGQFNGMSLIYFLLVPLFWLAIRVGPRFTILGLFVTTVMLIGGTFYGPHAIPVAELGRRLFEIEIFINILCVIFLIIAGLQEERTEATKQLRSHIDRLEDALNRLSLQDRAKNDFIAVLAHELRNPLAPIVSALELLKFNSRGGRDEKEALDLMDDRLKTIQRLLDDLLDVSRISRSKLRLQRELVDLRKIINRSIHAIDRHIRNRNQMLVIDVPSEPMILNADPVRIEQIVSNLLTNASKFTPEGGRIAISARRENDTVRISVTDNGIGIDPPMLKRIFEAFLQLETGQRGEGLGIGLSLTQRLVEMHGGTIEAHSAGAGKGSTFTVCLPVLPENTEMPAVSTNTEVIATPASTQEKENMRVLVVDDNVAAAQGIGRLLEHSGYEVIYAYTGGDAKEKVSMNPDAIVLDIGLPDMDGYSLARMIRSGMEYNGLLIALTGYGGEEDKMRAKEAGFDHHLTKPVGIKDLVAILR
jgi:signal transduction histidine kinase/CheY-like chemotaxis protein